MKKTERVVKINAIEFEDGIKIDVATIVQFLEEAYEIIDTIGKYGNYTDEYLYFRLEDEIKLEPLLLKMDVIRESPNHIEHNEKVNKGLIKKGDYQCYIKYWLSDGFQKFKTDFWNCVNNN